ncbi:MAG: hypothetical protein KDC90_04975 [Ignavibacteriae bacterium]|nr:hypothetical protein [Ignavibacteriota bacterium]
MNKLVHKFYIGFFIVVTISVLVLLIINGYSYYTSPFEERFFLPNHNSLKPSGFIGHGLGIIGSFLMIVGVLIYMIRKRVKSFLHLGILKHWLELHIFLCTIGPILVLFHTAFKFGGIVSVSFWSMVAVFLSGIVGRFIYVRIPHTIEGREMNMQQINTMNESLTIKLASDYNLQNTTLEKIANLSDIRGKGRGSFGELFLSIIPNYFENKKKITSISDELKANNITKKNRKEIVKIVKEKISTSNRIHYLRLMQSLFKYWHVAHLPFALIMLIIMFIHIVVTVTFGYRWIF